MQTLPSLLLVAALAYQDVSVQLVRDINTVAKQLPSPPLSPLPATEFGSGVLAFGQATPDSDLTLWFAQPNVPAIELPVWGNATLATLPGKALVRGTLTPGGTPGLVRVDGTPGEAVELFLDGVSESFHVYYGPISALGRFWWTARYNGVLVGVWSSDGSQAGTELEGFFHPGPSVGQNKQRLYATTSHVFIAARVAGEYRLGSIAGPGAGLVDLGAYTGYSGLVDHVLAAGDLLWFAAETEQIFGHELWVSDGSPQGTRLVSDVYPGNTGLVKFVGNSANGVVFWAYSPFFDGLWVSDGTQAGTLPLIDLSHNDVTNLNPPQRLGAALPDGRVVFGADDDNALAWVTDGTVAGTHPLLPDAGLYSTATEFVASGSRVYFRMYGGTLHGELFSSDGSDAGTYELPASAQGFPAFAPALGGVVFDQGDLWWSLGTAQSTQALYDLPDGPHTVSGLTSTTGTIRSGDRLYFEGHSDLDGSGQLSDRELWKTDGTQAGTVRVIDLAPGAENGLEKIVGEASGRVLFLQDVSTGFALWGSDGTESGTEFLLGGSLGSVEQVSTGGFGAWIRPTVAETSALFLTDGTLAGTSQIGPFNLIDTGPFSSVLDGRLIFRGTSTEQNLWTSDGTVSGTKPLLAAFSGTGHEPTIRLRFGSHVYYEADGVSGRELYRTDGTEAGTGFFFEIAPGPESSDWNQYVVAGERLYFRGPQPEAQWNSLYVSDGTAQGTMLLESLDDGFPDFIPAGVGAVGDRAAFVDQSSGSMQLWITDGTVAGTSTLLAPTPDFEVFAVGFAQLGNSDQIVFEATNNAFGRELWRWAPGWPEPQRLTDLMPGGLDSDPKVLGELNGLLLFASDHPIYGRELFSIRLLDLGLGGAEAFGTSCSKGQPLAIGLQGNPALGASLTLELDDAAPVVPALAFFGLGGSPVQYSPSCAVYTGLPYSFGSSVTDGAGRALLNFSLPDKPGLVGLDLSFQWVALQFGGPILDAFATSSALELFVGP